MCFPKNNNQKSLLQSLQCHSFVDLPIAKIPNKAKLPALDAVEIFLVFPELQYGHLTIGLFDLVEVLNSLYVILPHFSHSPKIVLSSIHNLTYDSLCPQ